MTQEFKPGDVVCMKSGSPAFTVLRTVPSEDPTTKVEWTRVVVSSWNGDTKIPQENSFPDFMLTAIGVPAR